MIRILLTFGKRGEESPAPDSSGLKHFSHLNLDVTEDDLLEELDQLISSNTYKPSIRLAPRIAADRDTLHVALGEVRDKSNELIRNLYTASDCLKLDEAEEEDDDDNDVPQEES